jgi:hypothetical protein
MHPVALSPSILHSAESSNSVPEAHRSHAMTSPFSMFLTQRCVSKSGLVSLDKNSPLRRFDSAPRPLFCGRESIAPGGASERAR